MESENPDDHQRVEDEKKKRKQQSDRRYREKKKKKQESKEAQLQNLGNECRRYKAQVDAYETMMKPLLDGACETRKLVLEPEESSGHTREAVEKQTDFLNSLSRELLKTPLPGGGTCGSTSASTDKDAYPPLELSVAAMKSDGSVTTESFKPCQSLPEEWTQLAEGEHERLIRAFFGLREHYTATTARHALEIAERDHELKKQESKEARLQNLGNECRRYKAQTFNELKELYIASEAQHEQEKTRHAQEMAAIEASHTAAKDRHAQEMTAAKEHHDQEMAAANDRHAQEMAAAKERHDQEMALKTEYLENMGQPPAEDSSNFDIDQFLVDEPFGCSSVEMKNDV